MISMDGNDNDPNDDSRTEITSGEFQNVSNRIVKSVDESDHCCLF